MAIIDMNKKVKIQSYSLKDFFVDHIEEGDIPSNVELRKISEGIYGRLGIDEYSLNIALIQDGIANFGGKLYAIPFNQDYIVNLSEPMSEFLLVELGRELEVVETEFSYKYSFKVEDDDVNKFISLYLTKNRPQLKIYVSDLEKVEKPKVISIDDLL